MRLLYITNNDFEQLLKYANKVLEIEKDNSFGWFCKFKALEELNRLNDLILAYSEAFEIYPDDEELIKDKKNRVSRIEEKSKG